MEDAIFTERDLRRIKILQSIRVFVFTAFAAIVILVTADNTDDVNLKWLFDDGDVPLATIILVSWAVGVVMGLLAMWHVGARVKQRATAQYAPEETHVSTLNTTEAEEQ